MNFGDDADVLVRRMFGVWLSQPQLHGCDFASWAARTKRIHTATYFDPPSGDVVANLNAQIEVARDRAHLALAIFPRIDSESDLVALIQALVADPRWSCVRRDVEDRVALDIRHTASADAAGCSAIGFGPLPMMPSNRHAPFFALGLWPGGFDNPNRKKRDEFVGVGDMRHDLDSAIYKESFDRTRARTKEFREVLHESGVVTGITFCLSLSAAEILGGVTPT